MFVHAAAYDRVCLCVCACSYDLLAEDDPDDFVTLELPADSATTDSDAPPLELTEIKRKGGFLENLRRNRSSSAGITVITGKRPMRVSGGVEGGVRGKNALPLHELADEQPCVVQREGEEEEEEEEEGGEGSLNVQIRLHSPHTVSNSVDT